MSLFFAQPGIFLAWSLINGDDPKALVDKCADTGFKWIAVEYGDPATQPTNDEVVALRAECHARGLYAGLWQNRPRDLASLSFYKNADGSAWLPNFWILNVESDPFDYTQLLTSFRAAHPTLPAGVITNGDPNVNFAPFIAHDIKALPEAYQNAGGGTPQAMVDLMKSRGYTYVFPVPGVYDGYPASNYTLAGDGFSVYLYEGMTDADFATVKAWITGGLK